MATILDSIVGSCVKKLQDIITEEAVLILGVKGDLKELQRTMKYIQGFLDAATQRIEESAIDNWLSDLKDAMYEADDIIDLARLEGSKLLAGHPSSSRNSAACIGFSFFSCIPNIKRRHEIAVRIRNFNTDLDKILKLGEKFNLQQHEPCVSPTRKMKTCSLVEPNLVGKEITHACTKLIEQIHANKGKKVYKIGIVGTGGVGKTTLASKIYNDQRIKGLFSKKAWICVSQEYSEVSILKEVLGHLNEDYKQDENFDGLSTRLEEAVKNTSFLLVLDDIWEHDVWTNVLRVPLNSASAGIILLTTRIDTVARVVGAEYLHKVELMSEHTGWELLWRTMNISEEIEVYSLIDIGIEIVRKCGCLPLAIKLIASVLATKEKTVNEWGKFVNKSVWSMSKLPPELRGALYLSYDELPQYLRQCFLYCALLPEDHRIFRDDLVRYWIAEGFVEEQEGQLLEDTAEEYYYELIHRNLLQPDTSFIDYCVCKMHDLLRQLAQHLLGEEFYYGDPKALEAKPWSKIRRISIVGGKGLSLVAPSAQKEHTIVRTVLSMCEALKVDNTMFKGFPRIRVLDLSYCKLQHIPDCIGSLIHLRLLDLDRTSISYLPESIGYLINLQILNLGSCYSLHSLPSGITRLCNLRRLGLYSTPINLVPKGIGRLSNINDLEGFRIGDGEGNNDGSEMQDGWNLKELGPLLQLRRLRTVNLERAVPSSTDSLLLDKKHLKDLNLSCTWLVGDQTYLEDDTINVEKTFELLIPPQNLEHLTVDGFFGRRFPTWLDSTIHFPSLKYLNLRYCKSCVCLPPIGQLPNLKYLTIEGTYAVTMIGPEFIGCGVGNPGSVEVVAFPKLELLHIDYMTNWEEWSFVGKEEVEAIGTEERMCGSADGKQKEEALLPRMRLLPCLEKLRLTRCPKLRAFPQQLGKQATSLKTIYLTDVDDLKVVENFPFLSEELSIMRCRGLVRVLNLPKVRVLRVDDCPNLSCVENLDDLQELFQTEDMREATSQWLPGLQRKHQELHGGAIDVYTRDRFGGVGEQVQMLN